MKVSIVIRLAQLLNPLQLQNTLDRYEAVMLGQPAENLIRACYPARLTA